MVTMEWKKVVETVDSTCVVSFSYGLDYYDSAKLCGKL